MNFFINIKSLLLIMLFATVNFNVWAETYNYHADVKGMVCAFCAYSVSKNVSKLPGVDADSVNVDLKGGSVTFRSKEKVEEKKLAELFGESGFAVSNLTVTTNVVASKKLAKKPSLELQIDIFKVDQLTGVIEAIGNIAASTPSRLVINAPLTQEDIVLKPLLMGRQQVIKVRFVPTEEEIIKVQLFDAS
ncbi:hypothetical protein MNBD_GAMMA06-253 [hydrothermal vent metagenome]|uniref:HMA domain-containing protein n=1 Tax=hydrothermal vent metagenome TaxID=652676 RepID=A0A3B0XC76_9ZZZZ